MKRLKLILQRARFYDQCGLITTLIQPSCFARNVLYICGASSNDTRCVTTNDGSIAPLSMYRSSRGRYLWTCVCPVLIVSPLFMAAPKGNLSRNPPYTPGTDTVPPFRHEWIAWRSALTRSVAMNVIVLPLSYT